MKTKTQISFAVTAKLICAFVFTTRTVQFLYFLNPKFPVSSLLCLYSMVCVRPVRKPHCWFSHVKAHLNESNLVHPATAPLDLKPWKHTLSNILPHSENYMQISADGGGVHDLHPTQQNRSYGDWTLVQSFIHNENMPMYYTDFS